MIRERILGVSEVGKGNRRFLAIVSLGRNRWYWVVWPSLRELQASEKPLTHIDEGYEKTKAEAVERALALAGRYAEWIAAKYAKAYHSAKTGTTQTRESAHNVGSSNILVIHEFLYRDIYDATTRQWGSVPHRVVRRTAKYVYVEQQPYSLDDFTGSWLAGERPTYRLDRQALEQEGYAFIPATASLADKEEPLFFNYERVKRHGGLLPNCLEVLELSWPCTVTDVKDAYRRLVRNAHPDGAGSHDKFLQLQAAYEQALRICP
jgi:hypothetical protein